MANHFETEMRRPRELLAPSLLLLLAESPGQGYELMEAQASGAARIDLPSAPVVQDAGLIAFDWSVGQSGPGRRVYEITPSGRDSLDRSAAGVLALPTPPR